MRTPQAQFGFTLIEMIVSLAVFSGVVTIAVGALLVLVGTNEQLQGEQSVMTNLSFALDSMTREIRTGTDYYCDSEISYTSGGTDNIFVTGVDLDSAISARDIAEGDCDGQEVNRALHGIAFIEGGDSISGTDERILYFYDEDAGQIYRRIGSEAPISIISSGIYIHQADFFVTGNVPQSELSGNFRDQASVTVYIEASEDISTPSAERYRIQTSITQRTLDI